MIHGSGVLGPSGLLNLQDDPGETCCLCREDPMACIYHRRDESRLSGTTDAPSAERHTYASMVLRFLKKSHAGDADNGLLTAGGLVYNQSH